MKLFVGFDIYNKNIKILQAENITDDAHVEYLHFTKRIFTPEFFEEARGLLGEYFASKPLAKMMQTYIVLPNEAVASEIINIPNMPITKQIPAIEAELVNEYGDKRKNKKINRLQVMKTKQYTVFNLVYFDRKLMGQIYNLLIEEKLMPKQTTFCGNSLLNSVYACMPRTRGKSFIFADIRVGYTLIAVSSKGKTMGFASIPHGTDILKRDEVLSEYAITDHDTAEIAVINAHETARAKQLTRSGADVDLAVIPENATIEDYVVEGAVAEGEYSGGKADIVVSSYEVKEAVEDENPDEKPAETTAEAASETAEGAEGESGEQSDDDGLEDLEEPTEALEAIESEEYSEEDAEFYESSDDDEEKRLAEIAAQRIKKAKTYHKPNKRYPKFMLRDLPDTEEGFMYENFRIIQKWLLMYARQASLTEYINDPEFILVNMPPELNWLLEKANEDMGEKGLQFRPFTAADKLSPEIAGNLDLVGCMYAKQYNKHNNF